LLAPQALYFAAPAAIMLNEQPHFQQVSQLLWKVDKFIPHFPWCVVSPCPFWFILTLKKKI